MNGLSSINVELTSRCQKSCWCCGRRKIEREHPEIAEAWGDMPLEMVESIAAQVPPGVFVQLHNNGEPLLYPDLDISIELFNQAGCHTSLNTNGKLLNEQRVALAGLHTLAISIIQDDVEAASQWAAVSKFVTNATRPIKPLIILRILGELQPKGKDGYAYLERNHNCLRVYRQLHSPDGSHDYEKPVTIPEIGVCLEMLHKLSIDRYGNVSPCVRFDPEGLGILGNANASNLVDFWYGGKRRDWLNLHLAGKRGEIPFCARCDYWGIPRG